MDKLLVKHQGSEYNSSKPAFVQYAEHFSYNNIYTDIEREAVSAAKRMRHHREVIFMELEEILKTDLNQCIDLRKANSQTMNKNACLLHLIDNELPDLYECEIQDEGQYLTVLGLRSDRDKFVKASAKAKNENIKRLATEAKQKAISTAQADHEEAIQAAEEAKANLETALAANQ